MKNEKQKRDWFKFNWQNGYIVMFILAIVTTIVEIFYLPSLIGVVKEVYADESQTSIAQGYFFASMTTFVMFIPVMWIVFILFLAFIKSWKEINITKEK